jgi:hypothetical protein
MKKLLFLFIVLLVFPFTAFAAPLDMNPNLEGTLYFPEGSTADNAGFTFTYTLPSIVAQNEDDNAINEHFEYMMNDMISFDVPIFAASTADVPGAYLHVTSQITCNSDEYFCVLVNRESFSGASVGENWLAYSFARNSDDAGYVLSLANILKLSAAANDDGLAYERATQKANDLVYELIWDIICEQMDSTANDYFEGLSVEDLHAEFYPESDFYLDQDSNIIFYIQQGMVATETAGLLTFSFSIDELLSEL